jgi:hypothetical protein
VSAVVAVTPMVVTAKDDRFPKELTYQGKPLNDWQRIIETRNEEGLAQAFHAMRYFGPDGQTAIPALTAIVAAPFVPIRLGKDSDQVILSSGLCRDHTTTCQSRYVRL